jgi:TRAP-type uncharacterized transport system substrate-binding protein
MPGLGPGIHVFCAAKQRRGWRACARHDVEKRPGPPVKTKGRWYQPAVAGDAARDILAPHMSDQPTANPMHYLRVVLAVLALAVGVFAVIHALPPRVVTIETGPVDGSYYEIALKYRDLLRQHGINLELRPDPDSLDIIRHVDDKASGVDIGFTAQSTRREQFRHTAAAGAIELQPLFIFYNIGMGEIATLDNLRGKSIVMPPERSATSDAALRLLKLYGITPQNTRIAFMSLDDAANAIKAGKFDAGFFMLEPTNVLIGNLLSDDNLRLVSLSEGAGITRHLPFLRTVTLYRGSYDVERNIPAADVELLAATVNVVVRKDIHPAVLYMLLEAMNDVHHGATLISNVGQFPSIAATDLVPHPLAVSYAKSGMPWIYQNLPVWLASLLDSYLIIVVLIFFISEIYKSLKHFSELINLIFENLCLRALVRIEHSAARGHTIGGLRRFALRLIEGALSRGSRRARSHELLERIRHHANQ